jgi:hypothetical protein
MMTSLGYIRSEEVPGIPRREEAFGVAIYGPLTDEPADVVLVCALHGRHVDAVADKLATIASADAALDKYHRARLPGARASA